MSTVSTLSHLLKSNKEWAAHIKESDPSFFENLAAIQRPEYLWIGCSDSRIIPATSLGLLPGDMFVHRNVANLVNHTDINCLSVMQFAIDVLNVRHIIVCGHYDCGGVRAAVNDSRLGLIDNWLRNIQDTMHKYEASMNGLNDEDRLGKLCELNVIEQVISVGETTVVQDAWDRGQPLEVHGWIYTISDGVYKDLGVSADSLVKLDAMRDATHQNRLKSTIA